jgi:erythromycin esterase-like protein
MRSRSRLGKVIGTISALAIATVAAARADSAADGAAWLKTAAVPIATTDPAAPIDDLKALAPMFDGVRVVGLGEATHGTREHFQLKHRLVEYLVREQGFSIFSIEASTPEAYRLNDYVLTGRSGEITDPATLIGGMIFWTWNTEEVLALVQWIREFNRQQEAAGSPKRVQFTGFDMQTPDYAARIARRFIQARRPPLLPEFDATLADIMRLQSTESGMAVANGTPISLDAARGKRVEITATIRTRGIDAPGWAGLYARADGGERKVLAFDNLQSRAPRGTTDPASYAVAIDVPKEAVAVNWGLILVGKGTAWFDDVRVTIDGQPLETPAVDTAFEDEVPRGFDVRTQGNFTSAIDREQPIAGTGSLRLSASTTPVDGRRAMESLDRLSAALNEGLDPADRDLIWARHQLRIIRQGVESKVASNGFLVRDRAMADNVQWISEQNPGAKIVLWAHNMHIAAMPGHQGTHLRRMFGDAYLAVGFGAGRGTYYAMPDPTDTSGTRRLIHDLVEPPPRSVEAVFERAGLTIAAVDIRRAPKAQPGTAWLQQPYSLRSIGAMARKEQFWPMPPRQIFDVLLYTRDTTAAKQLDTPAGPITTD